MLVKRVFNVLCTKADLGERNWCLSIKDLLSNCDMAWLWTNKAEILANKNICSQLLKQTLKDRFIFTWRYSMTNSNKGLIYSNCIRPNFETPNYISATIPNTFKLTIAKFLTGNHNLPVESGRWQNIAYSDRICVKCQQEIGDEFHYLFICKEFEVLRRKLIPDNCLFRPNVLTFSRLINSNDNHVLVCLAKFVNAIWDDFCNAVVVQR